MASKNKMETINCYQPEFVACYASLPESCTCPACINAGPAWPLADVMLHNQQRESLNPGCEAVARLLLLNPQAFVLHISEVAARNAPQFSAWDEMLNQQCINLAIQPNLTLEGSLYAMGVLLSKAQIYRDKGQCDPQLIHDMAEQLALLAEQGMLDEQVQQLPVIETRRLVTLKAMGTMRLKLNLPSAEKIHVMLKLSELAIMPDCRLRERLQELQASYLTCTIFSEKPHIMRNILIYHLYHNVFPGVSCRYYGQQFFYLTRDIFQLKMLSALWQTDCQSLTEESIVMLFSAWFNWKSTLNFCQEECQEQQDSVLYALSLL